MVDENCVWSTRGQGDLNLSFGSDLICSLNAPRSVCLCWDLGVDFQGCLALIGDCAESHANLGQAVCASACKYIVCSPELRGRPRGQDGSSSQELTNGRGGAESRKYLGSVGCLG